MFFCLIFERYSLGLVLASAFFAFGEEGEEEQAQ